MEAEVVFTRCYGISSKANIETLLRRAGMALFLTLFALAAVRPATSGTVFRGNNFVEDSARKIHSFDLAFRDSFHTKIMYLYLYIILFNY